MFPAGAGVIPNELLSDGVALGVPRRCGGDPTVYIAEEVYFQCSPQVRG